MTCNAVSIVYATHREQPHFDWFADSLGRQLGDDDVEVIVVDGLFSLDRANRFAEMARGRFSCRAVPAKPTPFNGARRRTSGEYFAASSARNTGLLYARRPYIVFCDDLSVLTPGWWAEVRAAAAAGAVLAGAYQQRFEMQVDDGRLTRSRLEPQGLDPRWTVGDDSRWAPIAGSQLFGCSFGGPRVLLLEVNGFDELCDPIGGEDYHLGVRLEWTGTPLYYSRRMLSIESVEHHVGSPIRRLDKSASPGTYLRHLGRFGVTERYVNGPWDSSHMVLDILFGIRTSQTVGNYYLLSDLDAPRLEHLDRRFPDAHWFDGQPLSEL